MIDDARGGHLEEVAQLESPIDGLAEERRSGVARHASTDRAGRLRTLVDAHFDFIWRSLRRLGMPPADADDGTQRVFWIASQKLEQIEPGKERAFLFGTAYRVARDIRRSASRRPEAAFADGADGADVPDSAPGPEEFADRKRARALLDGVLGDLPEESRTVFVLFELEELTVPEIALLLEVPVGTVASRLRRARELFHAGVSRIRARAAFRGGPS